jgi:hypothetical protein
VSFFQSNVCLIPKEKTRGLGYIFFVMLWFILAFLKVFYLFLVASVLDFPHVASISISA